MSKVELKCSVCGIIFERERYQYNYNIRRGAKVMLCSPECMSKWASSRTGKTNPNYKEGNHIQDKKCIDCGVKVNSWATRCNKCRYIKHSKFMRGNNPNSGNPKNMIGKTHPCYKDGRSSIVFHCKDCNKRISLKSIRCNKCQNAIVNAQNSGSNHYMYGKPARHGRGAKYKGIYMRSSWERKYAKYLDDNDIKWQYEAIAFTVKYTYDNIEKEGTYTPDFYLPEANEYIEIKGWWRDNAREKFNAFKEQYKDIKITVLMKKELQEMEVLI